MGLQVAIGIVTLIIALGTKSHDPLSVQTRHFSLNKAFQACKAGSNELNRTLNGWLSGLSFWFEAGGCFWLGLYELRHNNDESEKCIETKLLKGHSSDFGNQILANREPSPVASPTYESMKTADPSTLCARPPLPPFNSAVKHLKHQTFQSIPSPNHKPYNIYLPRSPKPATFNSPAPPKKRKPSKDSVIGIRSEACRSYAP